MDVHLVDGTYELFRHYYAVDHERNAGGLEIAGARAVVRSMLGMLEEGATHLAVATDHVIESFRNDLWAGYKTGDGIEPDLWGQFHPLEEALRALGVAVWAMVDFEADDGLAAGAALAAADERVGRVFICTPDKDLAQCVTGTRVVQLDRRHRAITDADGVVRKFGVGPASIPDYLALVGDTADGYPGIPGWGRKSAALVLARYARLEAIPKRAEDWEVEVRGSARLAASLAEGFEDAVLFRTLATLRDDAPVSRSVDEMVWRAPRPELAPVARRLEAPDVVERAERLAFQRGRGAGGQ